MRVATLNVWGRAGDWAARRALLRRAVAQLSPDVLALQETFGPDHVREFAAGFEVVHQRRTAPDGGGVAVAARLPIRAVHELDLHVAERPRDFAAGALLVELADPQLLFVNHFPSWAPDQEDERERQALMLGRKIDETGVRPVVIAGDLDAEPSSPSLRVLTGRYRDAWEAKHPGEDGPTYETVRRIDYVLAGPGLTVERCELWANRPVDGVRPSDHAGVYADLTSATTDSGRP